MNWIDLTLIAVAAVSAFNGTRKGFILEVLDLVSMLSVFLLGFYIYPYTAKLLLKLTGPGISTVAIAFLATLFIIRILVQAVSDQALKRIPAQLHLRHENKILGLLPGFLNGLLYNIGLVTSLVLFPLGSAITDQLEESTLAPPLTRQVERAHQAITPLIEEVEKQAGSNLTIAREGEKLIMLPFKVRHPVERPDLEAEMLILINKERLKVHLKPLKADSEIAKVALAHSQDMFSRGYFSHYTPEKQSPFDRMRKANVRFLTAGENLALAQTLTLAHEGLMKSPGHRANILERSFGRVGIGILDGGIHGIMVTQNFRN